MTTRFLRNCNPAHVQWFLDRVNNKTGFTELCRLVGESIEHDIAQTAYDEFKTFIEEEKLKRVTKRNIYVWKNRRNQPEYDFILFDL